MNTLGTRLRVSLFGESHGPGIGALLDGIPPGLPVDHAAIQARMDERRPGRALTSARDELDRVVLCSGVHKARTTGAPVMLWIDNVDARPQDQDADILRPGHADAVDHAWSGGHRDPRGGGHRSGRLTAPLVAAAALVAPLIGTMHVSARLDALAGFPDSDWDLRPPSDHPEPAVTEAMAAHVEAARKAGDSLGGRIAWRADHVPPLLGDPYAEAADARLAAALMAVPGVKGVSIGAGMDAAGMRGSKHNKLEEGEPSAHAGGIEGGRTNGAPLWGHVAMKPTPSIAREQEVHTTGGEIARTRIRGRHDPCIAIRAVPVVRAVVELVLADLLLLGMQQGHVPPHAPASPCAPKP